MANMFSKEKRAYLSIPNWKERHRLFKGDGLCILFSGGKLGVQRDSMILGKSGS